MKRYLTAFLFILLAISSKGQRQDTSLSVRERQAYVALKMSKADFTPILTENRSYGHKLAAILQDKSLTNDQRRKALGDLHVSHDKFMKQHLTDEQRRKLAVINKNNTVAMNPAREKRNKELKERLQKKGAKVTTVIKK